MQIKGWVTFLTNTGTLYNTCRTWRNPYRLFLNFLVNTNLPFGIFFTIFHHFYQNSKLLKLIQNTLDVLLIIIHNLSFYTKMISVIFHPWKIKYPQKIQKNQIKRDFMMIMVWFKFLLMVVWLRWLLHDISLHFSSVCGSAMCL